MASALLGAAGLAVCLWFGVYPVAGLFGLGLVMSVARLTGRRE